MNSKIEIKRLKNGLRFLHVPQKSSPAVTVMVLVNVGSEFERKNESGISHFLEHMLFKGTERRPKAVDISLELDALGARYNAFTSREYTGYYIKSAKSHFEQTADVLADMVLNSTLSPDDVERERGVILEEINMYQDFPQELVRELYTELHYGDQPAGRDILGSKETVSNFSRQNFITFKKKHYIPEKMLVVVSGGVDERKATEVITGLFGDLANEDSPKAKTKVRHSQSAPRLALKYKKTDQAHLILGVEAVPIDHPDTAVLRIMNSILDGGMSSRIFQKLREEMGVAYYAGSSLQLLSDHGAFVAVAGVNTSRTAEVVEALLDEFRKLREEEVTKEELKKAKDHYIGSLLLGLETSDALARFYGFQEIIGKEPESPKERIAKIKAVKKEDIMKAAQKYLDPRRMNLAIVGPHRSEGPFRKLLDKSLLK